jgi:hypothetical protein
VRRDAKLLLLVELTEAMAARAADLLLAHTLRAGDAVQLACCMFLRDEADPDVRLIAYDPLLTAAAASAGIAVE